jgi:hypothetical protein
MEQGKPTEAAAYLQQAVRLRPGHASTHIDLVRGSDPEQGKVATGNPLGWTGAS